MSSSAQIGMVGCVNAIEQIRDGFEEDRFRALLAEALGMFATKGPDGTYIPRYTWRHNSDCRDLIARVGEAMEMNTTGGGRLRAALLAAREWIARTGKHQGGCKINPCFGRYECTCGLAALTRQIEEALEER